MVSLPGSIANQCFNAGRVNARHIGGNLGICHVGGIVGTCISDSKIKNSYNTGSVYGYSEVGGIMGFYPNAQNNDETYMHLENCYNATTEIFGNSNVGTFGGALSNINGRYLALIKGTKPEGGGATGCKLGVLDRYTLEEMASTAKGESTSLSLLDLLSQGEGAGIWAQKAEVNGGLPYLKNNKPIKH